MSSHSPQLSIRLSQHSDYIDTDWIVVDLEFPYELFETVVKARDTYHRGIWGSIMGLGRMKSRPIIATNVEA
jgi:hypothetical protein